MRFHRWGHVTNESVLAKFCMQLCRTCNKQRIDPRFLRWIDPCTRDSLSFVAPVPSSFLCNRLSPRLPSSLSFSLFSSRLFHLASIPLDRVFLFSEKLNRKRWTTLVQLSIDIVQKIILLEMVDRISLMDLHNMLLEKENVSTVGSWFDDGRYI